MIHFAVVLFLALQNTAASIGPPAFSEPAVSYPDDEGNCPTHVSGRLIAPPYSAPLPSVPVTGIRRDIHPAQKTILSSVDGWFDFGYARSASRDEIDVQVEGMENVMQNIYVPANHGPMAKPCLPNAGIYVEILLHPLAKPGERIEDSVGIESLAEKIPGRSVQMFENSVNKPKAKTEDDRATLQEIVKTAPDYYDANLQLALAYQKAGQDDDAVRAFTHAFELNSGSMAAQAALGQYAFKAGEFSKAEELLEGATRLGNATSDVYFVLGSSYYKLGKLDLAEACLLRALDINHTWGSPYLQLFNVYMRMGQREKAVTALKDYLEKFPDAADRDSVRSMIDKYTPKAPAPNPALAQRSAIEDTEVEVHLCFRANPYGDSGDSKWNLL